jgi:2-C-methyl-D-erythritol 4-phosphate cytidylyltransferase
MGGASRHSGETAVKKEYRILPGEAAGERQPRTVLGAAVRAFCCTAAVTAIVVTVPPHRENAEEEASAALPRDLRDRVVFVRGGENRQASVYHALFHLDTCVPRCGYVLIHDGARPWVSTGLIEAVIAAMLVHEAAIPVLPAIETPKVLSSRTQEAAIRGEAALGFIAGHLSREKIVFAQTPQGFAFGPLLEAHKKAARTAPGTVFTDDAAVWAFAWPDIQAAAVPGEAANKKITFPEDLASC